MVYEGLIIINVRTKTQKSRTVRPHRKLLNCANVSDQGFGLISIHKWLKLKLVFHFHPIVAFGKPFNFRKSQDPSLNH